MPNYAIKRSGAWDELAPARPFVDEEGYSWPAEALTPAWSDEERIARGVYEIAEPDPVPAGQQSVGFSIEDDDEDLPVRVLQIEDIPLADLKATRVDAINAQRDALINGGFAFTVDGQVHSFQSRQSDRENIATMGMLAQLAVAGGAEADDYRWHGGDADFVWITADNDLVTLDAQEMAALFAAGVAFKSAKTFYARGLKDAVLAAANTAAVLAVDAETPWP